MRPSLHNDIFSDTECLSREQLLGYANNELPPEERHAVERHLVECEMCEEALAGLALAPVLPEQMEAMDKRMAAVLATGSTGAKPGFFKRYGWYAAASIALLCTVFFWQVGPDVLFPDPIAEHQTEARKPESVKSDTKSEKEETTNSTETDEASAEEKVAEEEAIVVEQMEAGNVSVPAKAKALPGAPPAETLATPQVAEVDAEAPFIPAPEETAAEDDYELAEAAPEAEEPEMQFDRRANDGYFFKDGLAQGQESAMREQLQGFADTTSNLAVVDEEISTDLVSDFDPAVGRYGNSIINEADPQTIVVDPGKVNQQTTGSSAWTDNTAAPANKKFADNSAYPSVYILNFKTVDYSDVYEPNENSTSREVEDNSVSPQYENRDDRKATDKDLRARARIAKSEMPGAYRYSTDLFAYEDYLELALLDFEAGRLADAMDKFNTIDEQYPGDLNAAFYNGLCNYELESYSKAITSFDAILSNENTVFHQEARWYKAQSLIALNRVAEAKTLLQTIVANGEYYKEKAEEKLKELE